VLQRYAKKAEGIAVTTMPYGEVTECQTFTCGHCQAIVKVQPGIGSASDGTGLCKVCMSMVCKRCNAAGKCTPWEEQMEKIEARDRARRSYGI
jgi:hypothetical protein